MGDAVNFEIVIQGFESSVEEYTRAQRAPASDLPPLNEAQKDMARRFQMTEEQYQRGFLAGLYGQKRKRARGVTLGRVAEEALASLGPDYRLRMVRWDFDRDLWWFRVQKGNERVVDIPISWELGEDMLDAGDEAYRNEFKHRLRAGVERQLAGKGEV